MKYTQLFHRLKYRCLVAAFMPLFATALAAGSGATLIFNVNLVPMDAERLLPGQAVLIQGGRIVAIGRTGSLSVPEGTERVDGAGGYLLPGLVDLHVHIFTTEELPLYVANGVTTVRNLWGWDMHLDLRRQVDAGEVLGPRIFTSSILDGDPPQLRGSTAVTSAATAKEAVAEQASAGYDAIKVYNGLTREAYSAIVAAAGTAGLPVVGHVPSEVGLDEVLTAGQHSIEHLWGYDVATRSDDSSDGGFSGSLDTERIEQVVRATVAAGTWNVPTLVLRQQRELSAAESASFLTRPELAHLPKQNRNFCCRRPYDPADDLAQEERAQRKENRLQLVAALHRAGAGILLGTDTGNPFVLPGFAVHDELRLLVEAGLSPYEALRAATVSAATFLGNASEAGTIAVGKNADLVLVAANPLADVGSMDEQLGVMVAGRWLDRVRLAELLATLGDEAEANGADEEE